MGRSHHRRGPLPNSPDLHVLDWRLGDSDMMAHNKCTCRRYFPSQERYLTLGRHVLTELSKTTKLQYHTPELPLETPRPCGSQQYQRQLRMSTWNLRSLHGHIFSDASPSSAKTIIHYFTTRATCRSLGGTLTRPR